MPFLTKTTMQHPDDEHLRLFVAGHLDAEQEKTVEEHLAQCPECMNHVYELERMPQDPLFQNVKAAAMAGGDASSHTVDYVARSSPLSRSVPSPLMPGDILSGTLRLEEKLGRGGMGEAWKAVDTLAERHVVLKFVLGEIRNFQEAMDSVRQSFQRIHALQHQHICPVYSLVDDPKLGIFIVMKYIDGLTLSEYRRRQKEKNAGMSFNDVIQILWAAAKGLDYAHDRKVIHRDIKPGNIMIGRKDGVQIIDFGLAEEIQTALSQGSEAVSMSSSGTRAYMAPEQWLGKVQDARTDQYALAATAYELFAGHPPFLGTDATVLRECALNEQPEPILGLPDHVNEALFRAFAKKREDRFPNCKAFVKAMVAKPQENAAEPSESDSDQPEAATAPAVWELKPPVRKKFDRRIRTALTGLGGIILAVVFPTIFGFYLGQTPLSPTEVPAIDLVEATPADAVTVEEERKPTEEHVIAPELTPEETERLQKVRQRLADIPEAKTIIQVKTYSGMPTSGQFTPDGKYFIAASQKSGGINIVELATKTSIPLRRYENVHDTALLPDGRTAVVGADLGIGMQGNVVLWDFQSKKEILKFKAHSTDPTARFSADGSLIVTFSPDKTVAVWDSATGKERRRFRGLAKNVTSVDITPDNRLLAAGCPTGETKVWDIETDREVYRLRGHSRESVNAVSFNHGGTILATGSSDHTVAFWDVKTGRPLKRLVGSESAVTALNFSPDDSQLIVGCFNGFHSSVWDVEAGLPLCRLPQPDFTQVQTVPVSRDGKMIATCAHSPIAIWETPTKEELTEMERILKEKRETAKELLLREMPPPERTQIGDKVWYWHTFASAKREHPNSLYAHALSKFVFRLNKQWKMFKTEYGLLKGTDLNVANCIFIVKCDNKEVFRSEAIQDDLPHPLEIDVQNVTLLELIVDPNGPKHWDDAVWFTPRLLR